MTEYIKEPLGTFEWKELTSNDLEYVVDSNSILCALLADHMMANEIHSDMELAINNNKKFAKKTYIPSGRAVNKVVNRK